MTQTLVCIAVFLLGSSLQYNFLALHSENLARTRPRVFTDQTHPDSRQKVRKLPRALNSSQEDVDV